MAIDSWSGAAGRLRSRLSGAATQSTPSPAAARRGLMYAACGYFRCTSPVVAGPWSLMASRFAFLPYVPLGRIGESWDISDAVRF